MPSAEEITRHHEPNPFGNPWVTRLPAPQLVEIGPYDPAWPQRFEKLATGIRIALGDIALAVEHVGSNRCPASRRRT
jgi:GrpB-like predicted nucleotidyltransferase (UPF0157 family)